MLSHEALMSSKKKAQKLSAYEADPITVDDCLRSENWETPKAGNSWKEAILNEIGNLMKFKVFDVISWQDVPTGERVWQIVVNFLTKRTKDSTPERECIDKRKCRVCFGGHHMSAGVHFQGTEACPSSELDYYQTPTRADGKTPTWFESIRLYCGLFASGTQKAIVCQAT
jgi:hypothetical protein